jgi:hypothetical protein
MYQESTPLSYLPITLVMKALQQKTFRKQHCLECGYPFAQIVDKVVVAFEGDEQIGKYEPDLIGLVEVQCPRRQCRQHYRMEFATS